MKSSFCIILVTVVLLMVAGCSSPESRMAGKWVGKTGSLDFFKNKTGIMNPPKERLDMPINVQFKWKMVDRDKVQMVVAVGGGMTSIATLEGKDVLVLEGDRFVKQK